MIAYVRCPLFQRPGLFIPLAESTWLRQKKIRHIVDMLSLLLLALTRRGETHIVLPPSTITAHAAYTLSMIIDIDITKHKKKSISDHHYGLRYPESSECSDSFQCHHRTRYPRFSLIIT
eukprot:g22282.t1